MGIVPLAMRGSRRRAEARRRRRTGGFRRRGTTVFGGFRRKGYVQFGGLRHAPRRHLVSSRIISRSGMRRRRLGRRRRVRRGMGIMDMLKKAHSFAKENKLISRGLSMIPHEYAKTASSLAGSLGYGRRRVRRMRLGRRVGMRRMRLGRRHRRTGRARMRLGRRVRRTGRAHRRVGMGYLPNVSHF